MVERQPKHYPLESTADSADAPFTQQFLDEQRQLLGEQDFKQEYLGIPGGGMDSPFDWTLYELATQILIRCSRRVRPLCHRRATADPGRQSVP